jgi:folate-binding protein YgfZ
MQLYKLNKTVFSIRNNPAQFLNGITSNSLDKPRNAFLNVHGRIIATFDQIKISEDEYWIAVETPYVDKLLAHIDRYVKLSGVQIQKLDKRVYYRPEERGDNKNEITIPQKKGQMLIAGEIPGTLPPDETFTLLRLKHRMPLQGADYTDDFVLNVDPDEYVSFTKGCFLGQEPVSKVHNRSRPTWRLMVQYEDECDEETKAKMTSKALDPDTNRVLGFTFVRNQED